MITFRSIFGYFEASLIPRQTDESPGFADAQMDELMLKERHAARLGNDLAMTDADRAQLAEAERRRRS
jgi:hypothetical protein